MAILKDKRSNFKVLFQNLKIIPYTDDDMTTLSSDEISILHPREGTGINLMENEEYFTYNASNSLFPLKADLIAKTVMGTVDVRDTGLEMKQKFKGGTLVSSGTISEQAVGTPTLDDLTAAGTWAGYQNGVDYKIQLKIETAGVQDTFVVSYDDGTTWGTTEYDCTTSDFTIPNAYGISVSFGAITGHGAGDTWRITVTDTKARLVHKTDDTRPFAYNAKVQVIDKNNSDIISEFLFCEIHVGEFQYGSNKEEFFYSVGFQGLEPTSETDKTYLNDGSTSVS